MLYQKKPTLNKCVFKCFAKVAGLTVRSLNSTGNSFQQLGPATAKALKPQSVLWLGTTISPRYNVHSILRHCRLKKKLYRSVVAFKIPGVLFSRGRQITRLGDVVDEESHRCETVGTCPDVQHVTRNLEIDLRKRLKKIKSGQSIR